MQNNLKNDNIAKNKEFNSIVKIYLVISISITIITFIIAKLTEFNNSMHITFWLISLAITIGLFFWTFSGGKCPNCAARKHEKRLSTDLVSETFIGNKTEMVRSSLGGSYYPVKYAVFNRTYNYRSICKYCDYEWTGTFTIKEEEKL